MRGLLIVSCVLASLVVASQAATLKQLKEAQTLVANADCKEAGEPFPNPGDCGSFLQCEGAGVASVQKCPPGLQFNAGLKVCDYPWAADCSAEDTSSSDSSSSEEGDDGSDSSSQESAEAAKQATLLNKPQAALKKPNVVPIRA